MELVTIESKKILLNSRLEELSFSKTNYDSVVTQSGLMAVSKNNKDKTFNFEFSDWCFDDVLALEKEGHKNRVVHYSGKNPFTSKAKTFLTLVEEDNYFDAGLAICAMLTQAAKEERNVPLSGAGGIIVDITEKETKILFLPEDLFKYSAGGLPDADFTKILAAWQNLTIYDLPAVCFMRAVIAYKMITGKMPYTATDPLERNADLLDHKFVPVDIAINGINPALATAINKGLKLNADVVKEPGKKKKGKDVEDLRPDPDFPLELLKDSKNIKEDAKLSEEEFNLKVQNFMKKQASRIKFKRNVRRNKTLIITGVAGFIIAILIGLNIYSEEMNRYTGKGLTSTQLIETYYKSINIKDSMLLDELVKGKKVSELNDTVSSIYVVGKMRQQYGVDKGYEEPAAWIMNINSKESFANNSVFGITNLYIDDVYSDIDPVLIKKVQKVPALREENGHELKNKDTVIHKISLCQILSDPESQDICITEKKGTITLTYIKDQWKITDIDTVDKENWLSGTDFIEDFMSVYNDNEKDILKTNDILREKYSWLPTNESIIREWKRQQKEMADTLFMVYDEVEEQ